MDACTETEIEALQHDRCPDCGNFGFHDGPRGGSAINIFCCNPSCRAGFNVAPYIIWAQRIERGPLGYYGRLVHADNQIGRPICGVNFNLAFWPHGHERASHMGMMLQITCPDCIAILQKATQRVRTPE